MLHHSTLFCFSSISVISGVKLVHLLWHWAQLLLQPLLGALELQALSEHQRLPQLLELGVLLLAEALSTHQTPHLEQAIQLQELLEPAQVLEEDLEQAQLLELPAPLPGAKGTNIDWNGNLSCEYCHH